MTYLRTTSIIFTFFLAFLSFSSTFAETDPTQYISKAELTLWTGNIWILFCTSLVFIMHLGFSTVESGLTQSKNTINILFKNVTVVGFGILIYYFVGFNLMYPGESYSGQLFGFSGFGLNAPEGAAALSYNANYTYWADFLFQSMFAATAATIVSGAVAERMKFESFLIFSAILIGIFYPIVGMWQWGGGFLASMSTPFYDFAGSTIVHSVGGWAALLGAIYLGPRRGKFEKGKSNIIAPHSLPLATIGAFLLWFGWMGFNGGSVLSAEPESIGRVLVITMLGGSAGLIGSLIASRIFVKTFDLALVLSGILGGLVGITAGANLFSPNEAIIIGLISGLITVFGILILDKIKIDDPVGAIPIHLFCGIWATLSVGLFGDKAGTGQFVSQLIGVVMVGATIATASFVSLFLIKKMVGLRICPNIEAVGLDIHEHGLTAYRGITADEEVTKLSKS